MHWHLLHGVHTCMIAHVHVHTNCIQTVDYTCTHIPIHVEVVNRWTRWSTVHWGWGRSFTDQPAELMWTTVLFWVQLLNEAKTRGDIIMTSDVTVILYQSLNSGVKFLSQNWRIQLKDTRMSKRKILWWLNVEKGWCYMILILLQWSNVINKGRLIWIKITCKHL